MRDLLQKVLLAHAASLDARAHLQRQVDLARVGGASWADIGLTLAVTRQAAFKRFGHPIDPRTGAEMPSPAIERAEALRECTEWTFDTLAEGDYDSLEQAMTPAAAAVLDHDVVLGTWAAAVAEYGALERCSGTRLEVGGEVVDWECPAGMVIGQTTLVCEAGEWWGRVAFDVDDRIVGLLIVPVDTCEMAF